MKISIIGAGRVASHLARGLCNQHQIVQIMSPTLENAERVAQIAEAKAISHLDDLDNTIDVLFIAVSDQAIQSVVQALPVHMQHVLVIHTSGSTSIDVFGSLLTRVGVFYPLQSFSLEREVDWSTTPLLLEAAHQNDLALLKILAAALSARVYCYDSKQRLSLHLAAVFACNFTNYCYDAAAQLLDSAQVDFQLLYPLMLETATKATQHSPQQMQTGPAVRQDDNILSLHQQLLDQAQRPDLAIIYQLMSQAIIRRHHGDD